MSDFRLKKASGKEEFLEASKEELRVLIAITENGTAEPEKLSKICKMSRARTVSAISYWKEAGVLTDGGPTVTEEFEERFRLGELEEKSSKELAEDIRNNELAELFTECSRLMKKPELTKKDAEYITALITELGLDVEFAAILAAYLAEDGKLTPSKLFNKARDLVKEEIDDISALEAYICKMQNTSSFEREVKIALRIRRETTENEKALFKKWGEEYAFSIKIVKLAYDCCVDAKGEYLPKYMDTLLTDWHKNGCKTVEECRTRKEAKSAEIAASHSTKRHKKTADSKPKYGDFDVNDAFKKALERSYGSSEND